MKRQLILHPFLFAVYAVLGVYTRNAAEVPAEWIVRPLLVLQGVMVVVFFLVHRRYKDPGYAGLTATLFLFWLFFGHVQRVLQERSPFWNSSYGVAIALVLWTAPLALLGSRWSWGRIQNRQLVTTFLNATSVFLIVLPAYQTGSFLLQTALQKRALESQSDERLLAGVSLPEDPPDIYLIVVDAYGRADFLQEVYGFDNSAFIHSLEQKGFYVAGASAPNYGQTSQSLSSLLNMRYLDDLALGLENTNNRGPLNDYLQHSETRRVLQALGYRFVALPSATLFTQMRDADEYYNMTLGDLNEFEGLLLSSSLLNLPIAAWDLDVPVPSYDLHRRYILYSLDHIASVARLDGPKFVFVHLMSPHPPFVLDENGNAIQSDRPYNMGDASGFMGTPEEYIAGYTAEARYLNTRLEEAIDAIISSTDRPVAIILQGDHGPGNYFDMTGLDASCLRERFSILNAYYFSDQDYDALYPSISPVNSFRAIFNHYFDADLPYLADRSYYSTWLAPYAFTDVTEKRSLVCNVPSQ